MVVFNSLDIIVDSQGLPVSQYYSEENQEFAAETTDGSVVLRSDIDFRLQTLLLDRDGNPLPQLWDPELQKFVPKTKVNSSGGFVGSGPFRWVYNIETGSLDLVVNTNE